MIVPFAESAGGTAVYINPVYVVSVRPDAEAPTRVSVIKLSDRETIRVHGDHEKVADKLTRTP
jgi:hypothetical protein